MTYATLIDLESLTFDWVSESYCRLTGYNERELLGRSYLDLAAHDLPKSKQDYIQNWVLAGRTWRGKWKVVPRRQTLLGGVDLDAGTQPLGAG